MNIFVTGTDTSVGKTVVSAILCLKLGFSYWKPIQSGTENSTDTDWIKKFLDSKKIHPEVYRFAQPLSPHQASVLENVKIDLGRILKMGEDIDCSVIEGAGGLLVPLNDEKLLIDLIQQMKIQTVVVARSGLGTLNHTLLTLEALRNRKIEPLGVILVGVSNSSNHEAIEFYGRTKVLGEIPLFSNIDRATLLDAGKFINLRGQQYADHEYTQKNC